MEFMKLKEQTTTTAKGWINTKSGTEENFKKANILNISGKFTIAKCYSAIKGGGNLKWLS